ncbi:hypothetical protein BDL97_14G015600 [Sphagnum fallax]|nr:hypothetical protein BDL97_14G015600 [Sphagnum fallax]
MQRLTRQSGRHLLRLNPLFSSRISRLQQSVYDPHQNWNRVRHHFAAVAAENPSKLSARHMKTGNYNNGGHGGRRCVSSSGGVPSSSSSSSSSGSHPSTESSSGGFRTWYLRMLEKNPMSTKSVTAAIFFTASDITAQGIERWSAAKGEPRVDWDKGRTMRMLAVGLLMSGPSLHLWFNLMSRTFPNPDIWSIVKKVSLGQLVFGPCFNTIFFSINGYAQGERGQQILDRLKRDLLPTWQHGLMFWPLLDFITFRYFPIRLQVLFNNCCSFVWTIYLTSIAGKSGVKPIQA